jgi:hypothetical protein
MKKLLRDFLRLRNAGHALLRGRAVQPRHWTITVPAPRDRAIDRAPMRAS